MYPTWSWTLSVPLSAFPQENNLHQTSREKLGLLHLYLWSPPYLHRKNRGEGRKDQGTASSLRVDSRDLYEQRVGFMGPSETLAKGGLTAVC